MDPLNGDEIKTPLFAALKRGMVYWTDYIFFLEDYDVPAPFVKQR